MKIEKAKNEIVKSYIDLKVGEAFCRLNQSSTDLYIKTYEFGCVESSEYEDVNNYNAINLSNGEPICFSDFEKVVIPNCKIVIE